MRAITAAISILHPAIVGRRPYQTVPLPIYDAPSPLLAYKDPRVLIGLTLCRAASTASLYTGLDLRRSVQALTSTGDRMRRIGRSAWPQRVPQ